MINNINNIDNFGFDNKRIEYKKRDTSKKREESIYFKEAIQRLEKSVSYSNTRELKIFIEIASKFEEPERALCILHNCLVVRENNGYPSNPRKIAMAIKKIMNASNSIYILEEIAKILSSQQSYIINDEAIQKIKKEEEKRKEALEKKKNTMTKRKEKEQKEKEEEKIEEEEKEEEKIEEKFEYFEDDKEPSTEELKKIEREKNQIIDKEI